MNDFGVTYRELRKNRGISQAVVCKNLISRTTLSKFENGKLIPSVTTFIELLNRLDIGFNEFLYINQDYKLNEKQRILHLFFSLFSNQQESHLLELKKKCLLLQENSFSRTIELLHYIINSLIELSTNDKKDIPCLPKIILSVPWENLQKYSSWNMDDIKLINCCLYMFPLETSIHISNQLIQQLKKNDDLEDTNSLQCAIYLNITLLCLQNKQFSYAETVIDKAIIIAKKIKRYDYYSLAIARKSFLTKDDKLIKKALDIAALFEDKFSYELIESEKKLFFV